MFFKMATFKLIKLSLVLGEVQYLWASLNKVIVQHLTPPPLDEHGKAPKPLARFIACCLKMIYELSSDVPSTKSI